ncbi:hypothetical protein TWF730_006380 [Orbilia blumenaviensis]|uniref:RCC1/BLIP-II protein n=1 Tax=Orbilia blumenaviensis TaxID=1796055 RepID=A0AAV9VE48_9PEZI
MDPQEELVGVAGKVSTSRKRRRLSPTYNKDTLEPTALEILSPTGQGVSVDISPEIHSLVEHVELRSSGASHNERYKLLAFGCNLYGQLMSGPGWGIETEWKDTEGVSTDWLRNENADGEDTPAEPTREPNLFTSVDTPTVVMSARDSMRILYVGSHSVCVERDGTIYLRGILSTYAPGNQGGLREHPVLLPPGICADNVTKAFGTRWAFLGVILSDGRVCTFSLQDWSFTVLRCAATEIPVTDIRINRIGEICFLSSSSSEGTKVENPIIRVYPAIPSIIEYLYDASLQSLTSNDTSPLSTFDLNSNRGEGILQRETFTSIASTSTGFIALTSGGNVYTYGDRRFNSLGRPADAITPEAQGWGQVTALEGIMIEKISANPGGHVQVALAEDGTVYVWGGDGTENINVSSTSELESRKEKEEEEKEEEEVTMVDIVRPGDDEPVGFDIACVGEDCVILVEEGGKEVWVSGGSDMGQTGFGSEYRCLPAALGVDEEVKKKKGAWRRLELEDIDRSGKILDVDCGSGYTLVLLDSDAA